MVVVLAVQMNKKMLYSHCNLKYLRDIKSITTEKFKFEHNKFL